LRAQRGKDGGRVTGVVYYDSKKQKFLNTSDKNLIAGKDAKSANGP
jgi:hypothetical protein